MPGPAKMLLWWLALAAGILLQAQRPVWRQYTTNDGLPSNETYDIMQDSRGFIWIATDAGICRFNGYSFIPPIDTSVTRGRSAFLPREDHLGKIWFSQVDASLYFIEGDTVRTWAYNHLLENYRNEYVLVEDLALDAGGEVCVSLVGKGWLMIKPNGERTSVRLAPGVKGFVFGEFGSQVIYTLLHGPGIFTPDFRTWQYQGDSVICIRQSGFYPPADTRLGTRGAWRLHNGSFVYTLAGSTCLVTDQEVCWCTAGNLSLFDLVENPDGSLLAAGYQAGKRGLFYYASVEALRRGMGIDILPGQKVNNLVIDHEGGWWATTLDAGLFYCKNPTARLYDQTGGLLTNEVLRLATDGRHTLYASSRWEGVNVVDTRTERFLPALPPPQVGPENWALYYDTLRHRLWYGTPLCFWGQGQWQFPLRPDRGTIPAKKITADPLAPHLLYVSSFSGFHQIDVLTQKVSFLPQQTQDKFRTYSVTPDRAGRTWVTSPTGLWWWVNDHYERPDLHHPALRFPANDLVLLPADGLAISLRGGGLLLCDSARRCTHLTQADGLTADYLTRLYVSPDGQVLACSNAGLNRIWPRADGSWKIETITIREGLPSNQVNDALLLQGQLWIATNQGLVRWGELEDRRPLPPPVLDRLWVNGQPTPFSPGLRLRHHQNDLTVQFFAIDFRAEGHLLYQYRLLGADTAFAQTRAPQVNLANLAAGQYTFEVQAFRPEVGWSPAARWSFVVRQAWWQWWWLRILLAISLVAAIAGYYRQRLRATQREYDLAGQVRNMETAALRAQMNPHFIFNCLNSIQYFIAENDAATATRYLARFARLVRLALHSSVDGRHSLREEIDMLDSYLALEQLRFRGKFNYSIELDPELDADSLFLPPLLVQPFVENALLHGMHHKTAGGQIRVVFSQQGQDLLATITDNGPGWDAAAQPAAGGHKSVGMMLTQRRLDALAGPTMQAALLRENILDAEGQPVGARVVLKVPLAPAKN